VRIVEPDQAVAVRVVERQCVTQPIRPFGRRLCPFELEFHPITLRKKVDAPVEAQQEFQCVLVGNGIPLRFVITS
jgi:hypothetical protein